MNKFAKGCLITAAAFLGIGVMMGIVVSIIGGRSFFRIVNEEGYNFFHLDRYSASLFGTRGWNWGWGNDWDWDWNSWGYRDDLLVNDDLVSGREYSGQIGRGNISELEIKAGACKFQLASWEEDEFGIEISGRGECSFYESDGVLYVEGFDGVWADSDNRMWLYVPNDIYDRINLDIGAGTFELNQISAEEIICKVGAGTAGFSDVETNRLDLDLGAGKIDFDGKVQGDVKVECAAGTVEMDLDGDEKDYNFSLNCAAGRIDLGDRSYSVLAGGREINNHADYDISLDCAMGSIDVDFED